MEPLDEVDVPRALLLPAFDEFISYARDPEDFAVVSGEVGVVMRTSGLLFVDGALSGSWTRTMKADQVAVEVTSSRPVTRPIRAA